MAAADAACDLDDLSPMARSYLSADNMLYASPIYAESACLMYRKDLTEASGLVIPEAPTWTEVLQLARQLNGQERPYRESVTASWTQPLPDREDTLRPLTRIAAPLLRSTARRDSPLRFLPPQLPDRAARRRHE